MSLPGGSPNKQVWAGLQWSSPDVTSRGSPGLIAPESGGMLHDLCWGGTLEYDLWNDTFDVTYPPTPTDGDRYLWKHYLLSTSFAGGKNPFSTETNRFNCCVFHFIECFYLLVLCLSRSHSGSVNRTSTDSSPVGEPGPNSGPLGIVWESTYCDTRQWSRLVPSAGRVHSEADM